MQQQQYSRNLILLTLFLTFFFHPVCKLQYKSEREKKKIPSNEPKLDHRGVKKQSSGKFIERGWVKRGGRKENRKKRGGGGWNAVARVFGTNRFKLHSPPPSFYFILHPPPWNVVFFSSTYQCDYSKTGPISRTALTSSSICHANSCVF